MVYTLTIFKTLIDIYPTWNELESYLVSAEGGSLRIIEDGESDEVIIRYEKGVSNMSLNHVPWFRSVVWNKIKHRPVCVAPRKASPDDMFILKPNLHFQDYLDGTMINMYKTNDKVRIITRSSFDATGKFYSSRSFKDLLNDAFAHMEGTGTLESWLPEKEDSSSTFMSLLLQHPEHRVVHRISEPKIYVIHNGYVDEHGFVYINEENLEHGIPLLEGPKEGMTFANWFAEMADKKGWEWQGMTIKDGNGNRWRSRSNGYRMVRSLRGNSSRTDVRFRQLFPSNLVSTYLYYYPEDTYDFLDYHNKLAIAVKTLYNRYVRCHITKTLTKDQLEPIWKPHIFSLHGLYLYCLKPKKQFIREKDVLQYVNNLTWQQILHILSQ